MTAVVPAVRFPARLRIRRWQVIALAAVIPAGAVAAYTGTNVWTSLAQRDLRERWDVVRSRAPADPVALSTRSVGEGDPVARMAIPTIGLDVVVLHGGDGRRGPAHVRSSAFPGLPGLTIVRGGRFGFGNHFMNLAHLTPGDHIAMQTLAGDMTFVVRSVTIGRARAFDPTEDVLRPTLVLVAPARTFGSDQVVVRAEATA